MNKELTVTQKTELVNAVENKDLGELLKPLIKEIHLFDSYVSNTSLLKDKSPLGKIKIGDKLSLIREVSRFDDNAIVVYDAGKKKIGYIPEKDNTIFARLMDAGKSLIAKVTNVKYQEGFTQISIGIYLQDF